MCTMNTAHVNGAYVSGLPGRDLTAKGDATIFPDLQYYHTRGRPENDYPQVKDTRKAPKRESSHTTAREAKSRETGDPQTGNS